MVQSWDQEISPHKGPTLMDPEWSGPKSTNSVDIHKGLQDAGWSIIMNYFNESSPYEGPMDPEWSHLGSQNPVHIIPTVL